MKILLVDHLLRSSTYRPTLNYLLRCDLDLDLEVAVPEYWVDNLRYLPLDPLDDMPFPFHVLPNFHWKPHRDLYLFKSLANLLKRVQPDILHYVHEPFAFGTAQMVWLRNIYCPDAKMIIRSSVDSPDNLKRLKYHWVYAWVLRYVLKHVDYVHAINESSLRYLKEIGFRGGIKWVPHAIDLPLNPYVSDVEQPNTKAEGDVVTIGYVGNLTPRKAVDLLLRAVAAVSYKDKCRVLIVGAGPELNNLKQLAKQLSLEGIINWVGEIPHTDIPNYYRQMDMFVLPSRTFKGEVEVFGRVLLEAMMYKVPIIASTNGGIPDVVKDAGLLFVEDNLPELVACLEAYYSPLTRHHYAELAYRRVVENFTFAELARRYCLIYADLSIPW